jgi:phospholipid/cholesterol/gamma-HCH transport system substrate-binding protein
MSNTQQTLLGLLAIVAMTMLGYYTLFMNDVNLFGDPIKMRVQFPLANGLREGDTVFVSGLRVGRVKNIDFNPHAATEEHRFTVLLHLEEQIPLFEDYAISIEESTLLGGRNVYISPGLAAMPEISFDDSTLLQGKMGASPMDFAKKLSAAIEDYRVPVQVALDNLVTITDDIAVGKGVVGQLINDGELASKVRTAVDDFAGVASDARQVSAEIRAGKGSLGKLLSSSSLHDETEAVLADLKLFTDKLNSEEGLLGRVLTSSELADEVTSVIHNLDLISLDLEAGQGTIGRLLKNDAAARSIESASADLASLTERVVNGEGTVGALFASDELYTTYRDLGQRLERIAEAVEVGDGSIAQLLNNREFFDELMSGMRLLNRSLEDYREAAPVSAFTTALFSIF